MKRQQQFVENRRSIQLAMVETMRLLKEHGMEPEDISFSPANLAKLIGLTEAGTINSSVAKEVFEQVLKRCRSGKLCRRTRIKDSQ